MNTTEGYYIKAENKKRTNSNWKLKKKKKGMLKPGDAKGIGNQTIIC